MSDDGEVEYRAATFADAANIAALHADSWRRHYRGAYPANFFDESLDADRLAVWSDRLAQPIGTSTLVAELDDGLVGFVHLRLADDDRWGGLVDNLHVRHDVRRRGIATRLMQAAAAELAHAAPGDGMYLWVLEQNVGAQAFYTSIGGQAADLRTLDPPALSGTRGIRMFWPNPSEVSVPPPFTPSAFLLTLLRQVHAQLRDELDGVDETFLHFVPGEGMNSIAVILRHVLGSEAETLRSVAGVTNNRDREAEFAPGPLSPSDAQLLLSEADALVADLGPLLTPDRLAAQLALPTLPAAEPRPGIAWLVANYGHAREHVGQIQLTKQLYASGG